MDKIVALLRERNKLLAKFSALNGAELTKFSGGIFDSIDDFYATREGILEIIKQIEGMIDKKIYTAADFSGAPPSVKKLVQSLLKERDELVNQILHQDLEILGHIDQAKNHIIEELQTLRRNRKVIGSYKSGRKTNVLDEEL